MHAIVLEMSHMQKIIIDEQLFTQFPDFKRGLIVISSIENRPNNDYIQTLLDTVIKSKMGTNCVEHEYVTAWSDAHIKFGSNPNKYPPSIKSLLKRIQSSSEFPFINSVVALFNYISIKYLIPCGGDDTNKIEGNLHLGFSNGNEFFIPLGSNEQERPLQGEVIYYDDKTLNVMCRRWNWRNGDFTKITEHTKQLVINIDGIGSVSQSLIESARNELATLLIQHCNAKVKTGLITKDNCELSIT